MKKYVFTFVALVLGTNAASARESIRSMVHNSLHTVHSEPTALSVVASLIFVICLIYITGLIYTKLNILGQKTLKKQMKEVDLTSVTILSTTQLAQDRNLHVIEIGGKKLLIGSTGDSVNLIKDLDEEKTRETLVFRDERDLSPMTQKIVEDADISIMNTESGSCQTIVKEETEVKTAPNKPKYMDEDFGLYKKYLK